MTGQIIVTDEGATRVITLRRPEALNALHDEMTDEILGAIRAHEADPAVAGFVGWLVLDGAIPLLGPVWAAAPSHERHHWLDVHHFTALAALYLGVGHVRRRWRALVARAYRLAATCHQRGRDFIDYLSPRLTLQAVPER